MTDTECAWLAGLFDGEGSLNFSWRLPNPSHVNGRWTIRARITNTHFPTLQRVQQITGLGWLRTMPPRGAQQKRPVMEWVVESRSAEQVFRQIMPFSVTKQGQLALALEATTLRRYAPRRRRGKGGGRGAPSITPETHATLLSISDRIKALNTHKPNREDHHVVA